MMTQPCLKGRRWVGGKELFLCICTSIYVCLCMFVYGMKEGGPHHTKLWVGVWVGGWVGGRERPTERVHRNLGENVFDRGLIDCHVERERGRRVGKRGEEKKKGGTMRPYMIKHCAYLPSTAAGARAATAKKNTQKGVVGNQPTHHQPTPNK